MIKPPFFSIIIPTYNRKFELKRAIESVLNQTFKDFELIIIDDGSTDGTRDWIKQNYSEFDQLKYHYQTNSGLPSLARNAGIVLAEGLWTCFLDSDDYWKKNKLERVFAFIQENNHVVAISHAEYIVRQETILRINPCRIDDELDPYEWQILKGNFLSTSTMTILTETLKALNGFDTRKEFCIVEDYELWIRLSLVGKIGFIDEALAYWTEEGHGISSNPTKLCANLRHVLNWHLPQYLKKKGIKDSHLSREIYGNIDYIEARLLQRSGRFAEAMPVIWHSLKLSPFVLKKWFCLLAIILRVRR